MNSINLPNKIEKLISKALIKKDKLITKIKTGE